SIVLFQILLLVGLLSAKRFPRMPEYCLHDKDYEELLKIVTILEASDRVGGRIRTYRPEGQDWYVELGAMRLPKSHRLVREFITQFNLKLNPFIQTDDNAWYFFNHTRIRAEEVIRNPDILNYTVKPSERGKSATQLYRETLNKAMKTFHTTNCMEYLAKYDSFSTKSLPLLILLDAFSLTGWLFRLHFLPGFSRTFQKALPNVIRFNCTVEKIIRKGNKVRVSYRTLNTLAPSVITADYVLVTSTARATRSIQFLPPLSPPKAQVLRSVHYGSSTKIALACSEKFWEKDGIRGGQSITDRPSRFIYYLSHNFTSGMGVILASYTWNNDAKYFLPLTDEASLEVVLQDLSDIHQMSKEYLQYICDQHVIEKWELDRHAMGAFAAFTPYQFVDYSQALFEQEGRVHFAGEHTAQPHAWIDTSIKSAVRAASNIHHDS
ncbi:OXLA oxidase, partial [Nyctibius bracteatus]|nr:OXLA oxidase [Nyctibius bracteatus]